MNKRVFVTCSGFDCNKPIITVNNIELPPEFVTFIEFESWEDAKIAGWSISTDLYPGQELFLCPECTAKAERKKQDKIDSLIKAARECLRKDTLENRDKFFGCASELIKLGAFSSASEVLVKLERVEDERITTA